MARTALTPVFVGLRTGLHVLFLLLTVVVIVRAVVRPDEYSAVVVVLSAVLLVVYAAGVLLPRGPGARAVALRSVWVGALTLGWICLLVLTPDAAYLVFALFFLYLHLFGRWWGPVAVVVATAVAISALALHSGWTVGGVVGPTVGAGVALLIGLGYEALAREAEQRERLVRELLATRDQLAVTEHESGVLAERGRLAREIHDTVAQGLSSIQLLLHAAERADGERPGVEHIRLARETAAANLADTRRFIRELTPPDLDDQGLGGALRRLAGTQWAAQGLEVRVRVSDTVTLPMHLQTALLRIAQGAVANVLQHAHASTVTITLETDQQEVRFTIADDGEGFDPQVVTAAAGGTTDSFGLQATEERVQQLGGTLTIDAAPGRGTTVVVTLSQAEAA
ncbi:sensor histidine kinase [Arthrobacter echini]|uniref:Sensor histidine kinase n=1 Tax=Arthrobacter echini TaxID=1529066 RepID=A0A4S5E5P4_9MICC|nr:sensor histidine kinase [Arthrobacter echini]THJ66837.1 sensor histidine kinase [Arthrobacter echini]